MDKVKRIGREFVGRGSRLEFYRDVIQMPDGKTAKWDYIKHKKAAAVVPVTPGNKIAMVRQYRNTFDRETLEIPAGALNSADEPSYDAALRELSEETGYVAMKPLIKLISIATAIAFCDEVIDIYLADGLVKKEQHPDEDEFINVEEYTLDELITMISDGRIIDSKSVAGILAYKNMLHN